MAGQELYHDAFKAFTEGGNLSDAGLISILGGAVTLLLAGNLYFIKRLVDKLELTSAQGLQVSQTVNGIGNQLREIKADIKDLRRIEIEVAVLKAQTNKPPDGGARGGKNET